VFAVQPAVKCWFFQLGNAGAFADALCSGQLLCSALLVTPVFCRNVRLGEDFWAITSNLQITMGDRAFPKLSSIADWLLQILYCMMHIKSDKKDSKITDMQIV